MHTHRHTHRIHSLFFTQSLFLLSLSSSFSASEKSWHRLGLGDVLRPLITLCQLCYTLVGVHLSFPICFCSHYLAPGQAPCLKYTRALVHMRTHTSFIFVLMTQFYNCVKPTHGIAGVFFFFHLYLRFLSQKNRRNQEEVLASGESGLLTSSEHCLITGWSSLEVEPAVLHARRKYQERLLLGPN